MEVHNASSPPLDSSRRVQPPLPSGGIDAAVDIEVLKTVPEQFTINCAEHANWLVKKIISARNYAERVKKWAEQEQRRAAREERTLMFLFGRQLEAWTKAKIDNLNGRRKSIALPAGTVGFRRVASKLVIDDEHAVLEWARQHCPEAVVVTEKVAKSALDALAETTGAIPDTGIHIEAQSERLYIR